MRRGSGGRPWHLYALGVLAVGLIVLAVLEIGLPSSGTRTAQEVVTAQDGIVQSTVTGSGNVAAGTDMDVNFKTSGTLESVNVKVGQHVGQGQLLATLDPTSAQLALNQAEAQLTAAEDQLTAAENGQSTGSGASASSASSTSTSYEGGGSTTQFASYTANRGRTTPTTTTTTTTTTPTRPTTTPTTTTTTTPARPSGGGGSGGGGSGGSSGGSGGGGTATTSTPNPASIASAQASVYSAQASVNNAEQTLTDTKLYAPTSGTIASLASLVPGDEVSASGSSNSSSSSSSSSGSSGSGGSGLAGGASTAGGLGGSSSSSSSSSSSTPFAQIINTSSLTMTVSFSESDITKVKVGQPATVTFDALPSVQLGARVTQISPVGTTSSGVVSYSSVLTFDQNDSRVRPGMSASASVVTGQASGVTVPNAAVTGSGSLGFVSVLAGGKTTQRQVVVGLRGDSRTQIISGLSAGTQLQVTVTLPSLSQSSSSSAGSGGTLGGAGSRGGGLGAGGGLGGLGGGGGFAGARALFRGGG